MLEEKCLPGKYKQKSTMMNEVETMKHTASLVLALSVFAHGNYSKLPGYVCSVPTSHLDNTSAHMCKSEIPSGHLLAPIEAGSAALNFTWSHVMQVYDMDTYLAYLLSEHYRKMNFKFCCLFSSAHLLSHNKSVLPIHNFVAEHHIQCTLYVRMQNQLPSQGGN